MWWRRLHRRRRWPACDCLLDNGRHPEALEAYREAAKRLPTPDYRGFVATAETMLSRWQAADSRAEHGVRRGHGKVMLGVVEGRIPLA